VTPRYEIDEAKRLVTLISEDVMPFEDLRAVLDSVFADPRFQTGFSFFSDVSGYRQVPSVDYVKQAVAYLGSRADRFGHCRWAVLTDALAMYGMLRMSEFLLVRTPVRLRGFRDRDEAMRWLVAETPDEE
jgi:hypothetical protein